WGPTLRTISSVWRPPVLERSGTLVRSSGTVPIRPLPARPRPASSQRASGGCLFLVLGPRPGLVPAAGQLEGAAQRVALEVFRQVELHKVGVAVEGDPEHLGALPLVPVGPAEDRRQAGHRGTLCGQEAVDDACVAGA